MAVYSQVVQLTPLLVKSVRRWKGQRGYFWLVSIDICNYTRRLMPLTSRRCVIPNTSKCECPQRWQLHLLVLMLACLQKSHNSLSLQKRSQVPVAGSKTPGFRHFNISSVFGFFNRKLWFADDYMSVECWRQENVMIIGHSKQARIMGWKVRERLLGSSSKVGLSS